MTWIIPFGILSNVNVPLYLSTSFLNFLVRWMLLLSFVLCLVVQFTFKLILFGIAGIANNKCQYTYGFYHLKGFIFSDGSNWKAKSILRIGLVGNDAIKHKKNFRLQNISWYKNPMSHIASNWRCGAVVTRFYSGWLVIAQPVMSNVGYGKWIGKTTKIRVSFGSDDHQTKAVQQ